MSARRFAYLFPGQGSQRPGMGRSLAQAFAECRQVFETADRVLERPLSALCFEGSAEDLALTENTQPAMLTVSIAALRALEGRGVRPAAAAGHSLGEYSAHVASGAMDFADAVRAVEKRGRFMQEAVPVGVGAMAAILGLGPGEVERLCEAAARGDVVSPANLNGPTQVVVAGHAPAVDRVVASAKQAGAKRVVVLPVSAPFHCSLMAPAADRLRPVLDAIEFHDPGIPVFVNADAAAVRSAAAARDALARQVIAAVRWHETIEAMLDDGIEAFVEVGTGKVLSGLVRGIRRDVPTYTTGDPESLEETVKELAV